MKHFVIFLIVVLVTTSAQSPLNIHKKTKWKQSPTRYLCACVWCMEALHCLAATLAQGIPCFLSLVFMGNYTC